MNTEPSNPGLRPSALSPGRNVQNNKLGLKSRAQPEGLSLSAWLGLGWNLVLLFQRATVPWPYYFRPSVVNGVFWGPRG